MSKKDLIEERYAMKLKFCQDELLRLVQSINRNVIRIDYEVLNDCMEKVTIVSGVNGAYKKTINVTSNNLIGITIDVLQSL